MPSLPPPSEDEYESSADSDFNASLSPSSGDESSASEGEGATDASARKGQKRKHASGTVDDLEMGSGDEGIVAQGRKKKQKKAKAKKAKSKDKESADVEVEDDDMEDDDEGGVGIRVRLRSGRGGEAAKKAALPQASTATANIDEIWARMNDPSRQTTLPSTQEQDSHPSDPATTKDQISNESSSTIVPGSSNSALQTSEPTITIPHTYTFAGQTHTSTKIVPVSSAAAQAHLATQSASSNPQTKVNTTTTSIPAGPSLRRPLARKNLLEPNPHHLLTKTNQPLPPRADLPPSIGGSHRRNDNGMSEKLSVAGKENRGEKLNTVEKSKLDWEAEVERQGMREELEKAEKSGGSYLGRVEFLRRVEGGEEEGRRRARLREAGVAS